MKWFKEHIVNPLKGKYLLIDYLVDRYIMRKKEEEIEDAHLQLVFKRVPIPIPLEYFNGLAIEVRLPVVPEGLPKGYAAIFHPADVQMVNDMLYLNGMKNPRIKVTGEVVRSKKVIFESFKFRHYLPESDLKDLEKLLSLNQDCFIVREVDYPYPDFDSLKEQLADLPLANRKDK